MTTPSSPDQPPVAGISLLTLARRTTAAFLSQLLRRGPVPVVSPGDRERRVTPLHRRRRSIPSYLGEVGCLSGGFLQFSLSGFGPTPSSRGGSCQGKEGSSKTPWLEPRLLKGLYSPTGQSQAALFIWNELVLITIMSFVKSPGLIKNSDELNRYIRYIIVFYLFA